MRCSEIKLNLPLYSDDILSSEERAELDAHLDTCPLCRQAVSDFQSIRNGLRSLARPMPATGFLESLRASVAAELRPISSPVFRLIEDRRGWTEAWLMPSAVGTLTSVVFAVSLIWGLMATVDGTASTMNASIEPQPGSVFLSAPPERLNMSPFEYANGRLAIADESPSVNPQGALAALTRSLVRGEMRDDEVVVVAEVFGNGLAKIAEVVEPSSDARAVKELQKALESDPRYAPFVPASFDKRSEKMRVVLKIQNVNVKTGYTGPLATLPEGSGS